jgi:hypothetical protein
VEDTIIRMGWGDGRIVTAGNAAIRPVIRIHRPRIRVVAMLHAWGRLLFGRFRCGRRLWSWRRTIGGDAIRRDTSCHRRRSGNAMRTLARRWDVPGVREGADIRWWQRR